MYSFYNPIPRHRVFISYYHADDQYYKNEIIRWNTFEHLFEDYSVHDGDIDDTYLSDEQIRVIIRDEYIKDATVLILLCGKNSKHRKYIDWELHAAMYDSEKNPKMGILVVNLPNSNNNVLAPTDREKQIISPWSNWISLSSRDAYEQNYPSAPSRIIDCLTNTNSNIAFVNWETVARNHLALQELVDIAFNRRKTVKYDTSTRLRRKNAPDENDFYKSLYRRF